MENDLEIYDPPYLKLPALKIKKSKTRQSIEEDDTVVSLIGSKLLIDPDLNELCKDLAKKSKLILDYTKQDRDQNTGGNINEWKKFYEWKKFNLQHFHELLNSKITNNADLEEKAKENIEKYFLEAEKEDNIKIKKEIIKISDEIQKMVGTFNQERNTELSISTKVLYSCKECDRILPLDEFSPIKCECGEYLDNPQKLIQKPLHYFNEKLINFVNNNLWLEYGVDYLLKRKDLQTITGYHVLGHSGVWHEIDNIAESTNENFRFFCECKSGKVKANEVLIFSGKMLDIGCSRGYFFTVNKDTPKEIKRLARSRNIDIVEGVLERDPTEIIEEIREK